MNELALFAGRGGGLLASRLLGWNTVAACEIVESHRGCLLRRQRDGVLEQFPIWDDVSTFDGKPWRGLVDVISGGFPCQDISASGKGAGLAGERSGLWKEYFRIIEEVRPRFVFAENSPLLRTRGLGIILEDLASLGYDARWGVLGAGHFGGVHKRARMWLVAYSSGEGLEGRNGHSEGREASPGSIPALCKSAFWHDLPTPDAYGSPNGMADRVERTEAVGNGQVPIVAANAFRILSEGLL